MNQAVRGPLTRKAVWLALSLLNKMKQIILPICAVAFITGCASVEKGNERNVTIRDHNSPHKIVKVDGQKPVKKDGNGLLGYYFPEVILEPGEHEFTILYSKPYVSFEAEDKKEIIVKTTLSEGYYELVDTGTDVTFKPIESN